MIRDLELRTLQRVRRYAVPQTMIERCTERRLAGDWRGACAAGRIDVTFSDAQAQPFQAELDELAPDLLRWHLPRALGGRTSLATDDFYVLSLAERIEPEQPVLAVNMPKTVDGSQRLTLEIVEDARPNLDLPPRLWSAARLAPQRESEPWPLHEEGLVEAWRAAGVELDPQVPESRWGDEGSRLELLAAMPLNLAGLAEEARRMTSRYGIDRVGVYLSWNLPLGLEVDSQGRVSGAIAAEFQEVLGRRRRIGEAVARRPADPDLLRFGLISPGELHPLVRQALSLPDEPSTPPSRWDGVVRVRCRGEWHEIEQRAGGLVLTSHSDEEVRRERAMRGLGGAVAGCFAVQQAWSDPPGNGKPGWLPKALRSHRRDIFQRIRHGGSEALLRLLDEGIDPRMCDGRGATLLHHLRCVDPTEVLPRLLRAGLDLEARDCRGRTPLHVAVGDGGSPELVRALLEAGANLHAADLDGTTVVDLADHKRYVGYEEPDSTVQHNYQIVSEWAKR